MDIGNVEVLVQRNVELEKELAAKTRELEIEAALEKVQARTMAMQSSDELSEAAKLLFQQVQALGLPFISCGYNIWQNGKTVCTAWMSDSSGSISPPFQIPLTESPTFMHFREAKQKGEHFYTEEISGEALADHYNYMLSLPNFKNIAEGFQKAGFSLPTHQVNNVVNFSHGNLIFITAQAVPTAWGIFKRFGKVFEQTYTRFLDLKQAEAQAREARIEAALERVRSRSMAMHKSEEVMDVAVAVYDELQRLDFKFGATTIIIIDKDTGNMEHWLAGFIQKNHIESYRVDNVHHPLHAAGANKEPVIEVDKDLNLALLQKGIKSPIPDRVEPMNCTLIKEVFTDANWTYEVKLDGYRIIAIKKGGEINLYSRSSLDYSKYYPAVIEALKAIPFDAVLDGEVVVPDEKGRPSFDQKYKEGMPINYYCFDLLWLNGYDITNLPLLERKELLKQIIPENDIIKYSEDFEDGELLFDQVVEIELEGIVAKRKDSKYQPGKRVKDWLKLPTEIRQEFVIGGWTESESGRPFRSIVFGAYDNGQLKFVGHSGSGFKDEVMREVMHLLKPLETKEKPFVDEADHTTTPHWVKPILVGIFKFSNWTSGGKIRKPAIFLGFREDKDPKEVTREVPLSSKEEQVIVKAKHLADHDEEEVKPLAATKSETVETSAESNWPELEKQEITSSADFDLEGKQLTLTNVERELWEGINKAQLIQYYHSIAPYILPYLIGRGQSLHVKHLKPTAPGLYIKDMEGRQPKWAEIFTVERKHKKKAKRDRIDYLVCNDEATLLYMVNLGCIDINPWTSRITSYLYPDFIIIDLDPSDEDFNKVIETANAAKQYFNSNKLKAFPKTSGKTGIHIYLPCKGFTFPEARKIAVHICSEIHSLVPEITTTEVSISKRGNLLYIDPNQNDEADTVAAPYSVRPHHLPTVSTPLEWKEINNKLEPEMFRIDNILERIEKKGDLFAKVNDIKSQHQIQNT